MRITMGELRSLISESTIDPFENIRHIFKSFAERFGFSFQPSVPDLDDPDFEAPMVTTGMVSSSGEEVLWVTPDMEIVYADPAGEIDIITVQDIVNWIDQGHFPNEDMW